MSPIGVPLAVQLVDGATVVFQVINFLILAGLLRYFLYEPITSSMARREARIQARWDEAEAERERARAEAERHRLSQEEFAARREELLSEMRREAEQYRTELTGKVRADANELELRWATAVEDESQSFLRDLRKRAAEQVCLIARRALADLAGEDLERRMTLVFLDQLERLSDDHAEQVRASLQEQGSALVRTAFDLSAESQERVVAALRTRFQTDVEVEFEVETDLICGLALFTDSHKLAWNLRDYLDDLEQETSQALREEIDSRSARALGQKELATSNDS
ncbi:MAG: F0F1 ATP synthase subunit delta [Planctomycetales bacterium]